VSQHHDNSGILGTNTRKVKDNHPDLSGQCVIDGKQFWISGWERTGRDGSTFYSLAFRPKMAREHAGGTDNPPAQSGQKSAFDRETPF
jgi:hypothetical protein